MHSNPDKRYNTLVNQLISNISDDTCTVARANTGNKQKSPGDKQAKLKAVPAHVRTTRIDHVVCSMPYAYYRTHKKSEKI